MKNQNNNRPRHLLPFFVEFVKFAVGFSIILAIALVALHAASAAM